MNNQSMTEIPENDVKKSECEAGKGINHPERVLNLADARKERDATKVGFIFEGNEYNRKSAWIVCDVEDLKDTDP